MSDSDYTRGQFTEAENQILGSVGAAISGPPKYQSFGQGSFAALDQFDRELERGAKYDKMLAGKQQLVGTQQNLRQGDVKQQRDDESYARDQAEREQAKLLMQGMSHKLAGGATMEDAMSDIPSEAWGNTHLVTGIKNRADFAKLGRQELSEKSKLRTQLQSDAVDFDKSAIEAKYMEDYEEGYRELLRANVGEAKLKQYKASTEIAAMKNLQAVEEERRPEIKTLDDARAVGNTGELRKYVEDQTDNLALDEKDLHEIFPDGKTAVMAFNGVARKEYKDKLKGLLDQIPAALDPAHKATLIAEAKATAQLIARSQDQAFRRGEATLATRTKEQQLKEEGLRLKNEETQADIDLKNGKLNGTLGNDTGKKLAFKGADIFEDALGDLKVGQNETKLLVRDMNKSIKDKVEVPSNAKAALAYEKFRKVAEMHGVPFDEIMTKAYGKDGTGSAEVVGNLLADAIRNAPATPAKAGATPQAPPAPAQNTPVSTSKAPETNAEVAISEEKKPKTAADLAKALP